MFTYDLATDIGRVRLLIHDKVNTSLNPAHFSDAEITQFLAMAAGSLLIASAYALESWAASLTGDPTSEKIGDYAYTKKEAETKIKMAIEYKKQESETPYLTWAEMDLSGVEDTTIDEDIE